MFWTTQNVIQQEDSVQFDVNEAIEPVVSLNQNPVHLPEGFVWGQLDHKNPTEMAELHTFLANNYVEDSDAEFRFEYPVRFLQWTFTQPNSIPELTVTLRQEGHLVGFIVAFPVTIIIRHKEVKCAEVDFLCIKSSFREQRLAPLLILEMTRRTNLQGIFQGIYTNNLTRTKPVVTARYNHRQINIPKLVSVGFSKVPFGKTLQEYQAENILQEPQTIFRKAETADSTQIHLLLETLETAYLFYRRFSPEEVSFLFCNEGELVTLISSSGSTFISFFVIPTRVLDSTEQQFVSCAYLYQYATENEEELVDAVRAALLTAKALDVDVFNCLSLAQNAVFLKQLNFVPGDGKLCHYIFNWRTPPFQPQEFFYSLF